MTRSNSAAATRPVRRVSRTDRLTTIWMMAALVIAVLALATRNLLPQTLWTTIHVVTLGVLTNAIFQWSWYFTRALLHLPPMDRHSTRDNAVRVVIFNVAVVVAFAGMWRSLPWVVVGAVAVIGVVVAWHGLALVFAMRTRLGNRFAVVIRYYVAAAVWFVVGCVLAGLVTIAMLDPAAPMWLVEARDALTLGHAAANLAGWIGLTMAGTLVTLGPTMLRTKMEPFALDRAVASLIPLCLALAVSIGGSLAETPWLTGAGLAAFAVVLAWGIAWPLIVTGVKRAPRSYATWTLTSAFIWVSVGTLAVAWNATGSTDAGALREANLKWLVILGAGGLGQVFIAALTYLMPVVIGGGPQSVKAGLAVLETAGPARATVRGAALALATASIFGPGEMWAAGVGLVLACYAIDIVFLGRAGVRQGAVKKSLNLPAVPPPVPITLGRPGAPATSLLAPGTASSAGTAPSSPAEQSDSTEGDVR